MLEPSDLDQKAVRLQFGRRVDRIAQADFLLREIENRMLERLELVRLEPALAVDVGAGLGHGAAALGRRYPQATVLGVDLSEPMARAAARAQGAGAGPSLSTRLQRWIGRDAKRPAPPLFAVADAARLPLGAARVDLLWSNLAWQWFVGHAQVLAEWNRVMRPGGLLMFTAFGPDTLRELRAIGLRLPPLHDMHDIGDALAAAGFAEPVMDAERFTVSWERPEKLVAELRALGGDASRGRARGLRGRRARLRWRDALEALAGPGGRVSLSFEVVYGHAWCPQRKNLPPGYAPISFTPPAGTGRTYPKG